MSLRSSGYCVLLVSMVALFQASTTVIRAEEPYLEFVQGLREQQYYDYAIIYLDQIGARANVPTSIKQVIPYQKAMILLDGSKRARTPEKQTEQLVQALAFLEQFVKESPNHPSAGDANSDRAQILLGMGQVEILQSRSPANMGVKREHQDKARELIGKARQVFQTAFDQHETAWKKYPGFIDEQKDPGQFAARAKSEMNMITAMLSLAMCTYYEAQTHDIGSNDYRQTLNKAAEEFEKMHQRYRSQVGGLYARAWQGKCFEEQNDLQKAMGIYNELLEHPGNEGSLARLKSQTLYFKLICLNSKDRNDNQLAADLADEWLKKHQSEARSETGLGIQWEQAKAYEALGDKAERESKADAEKAWRQARTIATQINKYPGEFKDTSQSMIQRLQVKLGGKEQVPRDFETAFGLASHSFKQAIEIRKEIDGGRKTKRPADELAKLEQDWTDSVNDAAKNFELALTLATRRDDPKNVADCRLWYAYVNYWQNKNYEAAVLAQYVARTADKDAGTVPLDAAFMAMAAFVKAYNENKAPIEQKSEEIRMIIRACNMITDRWPTSDKANDARMQLGAIYSSARKPAEAAVWYGKVPTSDSRYAEAQASAGQAYMNAYSNASRLPEGEKPSVEQLNEWLKLAQQHLRTGITKLTEALPKEGMASPELCNAKFLLATIIITQGQEAEAIKLLLDDPHSVIKAVTVADERSRPERGVTSRKFASGVYKVLLRAYIGVNNLDKGRETMKTLEEITAGGGADGLADVTQLYVDLGKLLKDELDRLKGNGETARFEKLMSAFETFLNEMVNRKEGQTIGTLSWIGETYFALGETVANDAAKSSVFYDKAGVAFSDILSKTEADPNFASPDQLLGVKVRQARVHRLKKEYAQAEKLIGEVIKARPKDIKVQFAACEIYQDWGASGQADSTKKLLYAVRGNRAAGVWGWGEICEKIRKSSGFKTDPTYVESYLDARFNGTQSRLLYARELPPKERQKELDRCLTELITTASVMKDMADDRYAKFNRVYREVLQESGKPMTDLPRTQEIVIAEPEKPEKPDEVEKPVAERKPKPEEPAEAKPKTSEGTIFAIFAGILVLGGCGMGWVVYQSKTKPRGRSSALRGGAEAHEFSGIAAMPARPAPSHSSPVGMSPKPKPRPSTTPPGATSKPPVGSGGTGTTVPKPRTKPPGPQGGA